MIRTLEQRHSAGGIACPCFGGSSSSATSSTTNNTDMRVVGGNDSVNLSAQNSDVSIIATDHGAVKAGMQLGSQAITASTQTASAAMDAGSNMFDGALNAVTDANKRLALAYQSGQAGDQTSLKYAGFVVVGLAAVMLFRK